VPNSNHKYLTLDALRGVAALLVIAFHARAYGLLPDHVADRAYLAVDFFFCLSGYVIAYAYEDKLRTDLTTSSFLRRRLARFYPLYLAGLGLGIAKALAQVASGDTNALSLSKISVALGAGLFFLPVVGLGPVWQLYPVNPPAWSLLWELIVNAAYASLVRRGGIRLLNGVLVLAAISLIGAAYHHGSLDGGSMVSDWWLAVPRVVFSFTMGVIIFGHHKGDGMRTAQFPFLSIGLLAALGLSLVIPVRAQWSVLYDLLFVMVVSPSLISYASAIEPSMTARTPFRFLGAISFPAYTLHYPLIGPFATLARKVPELPASVFGFALMLTILVLAWAASRLDAVVRSRYGLQRSVRIRA
jgi:peptidoglycan/LPS O-acetylase OafA/YrhL